MKWLTKSDYLKYLIHPAYLWLQKYDKEKLPPFDESIKAVIESGNEVETYARLLFNNGVLVKNLFEDSVRETEGYVKEGASTIFQAAVLTERRLYAKADVLTKNTDGSYDLHEIKSATKPRPEYVHDLTFQKIAFEESGYRIKNAYLIYINNQYVRDGDIKPEKLFIKTDLTGQVDGTVSRTKKGILDALSIMALPECPDDSLEHCRNWYGWRSIYRSLHPELSEDSVLNLCRLKPDQVKQLTSLGVSSMMDIPPEFELLPQQQHQLAAMKARRPIIHPVKIANHMKKLRFPLYFFDYETTSGAVPPYNGTRPYQQIPFQYSLHILEEPGGKLRHSEHLHTSRDNPMPELLEHMQRDISAEGSIVVWFKGFEGSVNSMMAQLYPEYRHFLRGVNNRMYDLMEIFSNFYYVDSLFGGSSSIKNVLPVLVPELSYADLQIQKGDIAAIRWKRAAFGAEEPAKAEEIYRDLRDYCGQDTLAMVKIYEKLLDAKDNAPGAQMSLLG